MELDKRRIVCHILAAAFSLFGMPAFWFPAVFSLILGFAARQCFRLGSFRFCQPPQRRSILAFALPEGST